VISTGRSALAGLSLLTAAGVRPVAACVAMAQTERWRAHWPGDIPLRAAFATPEFTRHPDGWRAPDR
jgi:adenine/guanine phosphoribosyltransferase-like PRPP-binding protein